VLQRPLHHATRMPASSWSHSFGRLKNPSLYSTRTVVLNSPVAARQICEFCRFSSMISVFLNPFRESAPMAGTARAVALEPTSDALRHCAGACRSGWRDRPPTAAAAPEPW
jgi:hypothetical protein